MCVINYRMLGTAYAAIEYPDTVSARVSALAYQGATDIVVHQSTAGYEKG